MVRLGHRNLTDRNMFDVTELTDKSRLRYPHTLIQDGNLYVAMSRQKEAVEVLRIPTRVP